MTARTYLQISNEIIDQLRAAVEQTLNRSLAFTQTAEDFGVPTSTAFLASARQHARSAQLFDAAVASVCGLCYAINEKEIYHAQLAATTPASTGDSAPETLDSGERTELGGDARGEGLGRSAGG